MKAEERYIIEVSGKGAGVLVGADGAYVFHAALPEARSLALRLLFSRKSARRAVRFGDG